MYFTEPQLTGNAFVDWVIAKRNTTHDEICGLREELQTLKDVIRSKQERLRKMNKAIILRQNSSSYLKLVSSRSAWSPLSIDSGASANDLSMVGERTFRCIQGGKAGS